MAEHELQKIVDDDGEVFNLRDSTKQPTADRVTSIRASSSASDDKYPSEKAVASAIESLDVSSVGGNGKYISAISETDGKISATATTMDTTPTASSTKAVTSGGIKTALDGKMSNFTRESQFFWDNTFCVGMMSGPGIVSIHDGFFCLDKRDYKITITKTINGVDTDLSAYASNLFNLYQDDYSALRFGGGTIKIEIERKTAGTYVWADCGYPYGTYRIYHYAAMPASCTMRVKTNYPSQFEPGWHSLTVNSSTNGYQFWATNNYYNVEKLEIIVDATNLTSTSTVSPVILVFMPFRPNTSKADSHPVVRKYGAEKLYFPLTAPEFVGDLNGKLKNARKLAVDLSNTSTDSSFDGSADQTGIKVSGTLPVANGGTGKTTAKAAEYNLTTGKSEISDATSGNDRVVFELASPSESNGVTRGFRKLSTIWTWIKGLLSSESGVNISGSSASCTGNAATATKATQDSDGNAINATYFKSSGNTTLVSGSATKIGTQNGADVKLTLPTIPSGTQLVYDCGTGSTSTTDFDNALAAFNAGKWVIIRKDGVVYYCVGTYHSGLRFKTFANESDLLKVRALTWTSGSAPTAGTQLEASLTGHTHSQYLTSSDITGKMETTGSNATSAAGGNIIRAMGDWTIVNEDNEAVPAANITSGGTTQGRYTFAKIWNWITSHHQVSIFKTSADVYVRVGADTDHSIFLDYDASGTSLTMGLWARWGSGSNNAKWMAKCDSSGNCTFNGNASSATTLSGSQVLLPANSTDGYIGVRESGKAIAYLEAYDSKGGVWVNNGGTSTWIAYRDSDGTVHFGADSASGYSGVAGDSTVRNLFNGAEICGNSYRNSGTSHYRFYFGKMTPGTDNGAKNFCGLLEVNNIATTSGAVRGTGFVAIIKIDARNYDEFRVNMSIINNNGWNLTGLRPTLIVEEAGDLRKLSIGFTNASGTLQAFQYTRFNLTQIGYSLGFTYDRWFSTSSTKSSSDYFWPATLGDAENAVSAKELRIPYGSGSAYLQIGVSDSYLALGTNMADGVMVSYAGEASTAAVAGRLGTASVGSANNPIYLNNGVPTACNWWVS